MISVFNNNIGRSGISLAETAIVLLIAGLLLTGIWGTIAVSRENSRRDQAAAEIVDVVRNVRALYQSKVDASDINMTDLLAQGTIPRDMDSGSGSALNPWGGGFVVAPDVDVRQFTVELQGLDDEACTAMASRFGATIIVAGLRNVAINGTSSSPPVSVNDAKTACNAGTGNNSIMYTFRLRQPNS